MAVLTHIDRAEVEAFLADLALGPLEGLEGVPAGSVNSNFRIEVAGGRRYFLRVYEEQGPEGAAREAALLSHLARAGVPTPSPLLRPASTQGPSPRGAPAPAALLARSPAALLAGKPAALFPWLDGVHRCQAGVTPRDARAVGAALARVHLAGQGIALREGRFEPDALRARLLRIASAPDPGLAAQALPLGRALDVWASRRDRSLPRGLIHGDLFRDNVLFSPEGELLALLDFESASLGVFAYDLMVTALAWSFGSSLDASLVRAMLAGYREVRELSASELRGLHTEACFAAVRFTITRITDYAMRGSAAASAGPVVGCRVVKDWRRFAKRLEALEALGEGAAF